MSGNGGRVHSDIDHADTRVNINTGVMISIIKIHDIHDIYFETMTVLLKQF